MIRTGYRLLLHPLKNYPGPQLAKISDTYSTYHSAKKSLHLATRQAHIEYSELLDTQALLLERLTTRLTKGPVIRLGPNKLVFNTVEALHGMWPVYFILTYR